MELQFNTSVLSYAGIGENVKEADRQLISEHLSNHGVETFNTDVFYGLFEEVAFAYIHPSDEMRNTPDFKIIQNAFINAYC